MSRIISALREHAIFIAQHRAIEDENTVLNYGQLVAEVEHVAMQLRATGSRHVAIVADNGIAWVVADLAALSLGIPVIALRAGFSDEQLRELFLNCGVDFVLTDRPDAFTPLGIEGLGDVLPFHRELFAVGLAADARASRTPSDGVSKVGCTVEKTRRPTRVGLARNEVESMAASLLGAAAAMQGDRHLCLLPLAVLRENIVVYTSILAGATICVPRLSNAGVAAASIDTEQLVSSLEAWRVTSASVSPQILQALVLASSNDFPVSNAIRYVAIGGRFSLSLRTTAARRNLALYCNDQCDDTTFARRLDEASVECPMPNARAGFSGEPPSGPQRLHRRGFAEKIARDRAVKKRTLTAMVRSP